jgi:hypothetical protein
MAYLDPPFDPDVFVSYAHGDPRGTGDALLKTWTRNLILQVEGWILSLEPEFKDLRIWIDRDIDPTAHLTDEVRCKVGRSGILMIVMSKHYLESTWCRDERDWFRQQIQDRADQQGRVFVLRAQKTATDAWPDFLRDERGHAMPGFSFFDPKDGLPRGFPHLLETDRDLVKELRRLQTVLTAKLKDLRDRAKQRAAAESAARPTVVSCNGERRIYLHVPGKAEDAQAKIGQLLSQEGIISLSAQPEVGDDLAAWQREAKTRVATAKRCEALALLRADGDGERFIGELLDIGVDERRRIAEARGAPMPCAVLDMTGTPLPIDVSAYGIERFDLTQDTWHGDFRRWLDGARHASAGATA